MHETAAREFAQNWLAAWTGGAPAVARLLSFYAPDALYCDPAHPEGIRGQERLKAYFDRLLPRYPDWRWEIVELFSTERGFTLKWKATLNDRTCHGLDIVDVDGAKIVRNEVFFDPRALFGA
ncbi:nuclear transport factor 2 family protein [Pendulispora albinea]|uniref:Nuclear transport factor 2 family protein n=1 Tax=Pendulispora albinea TaxID=2741071 RepID=A0ABZ2LV29_9BACT